MFMTKNRPLERTSFSSDASSRSFSVYETGTYKTFNNQSVNYSLISSLGKGSFGVVYALKNEFHETLAIKCKKDLEDFEQMEKSKMLFRGELEALYNLDHQNIVKLIGVEFHGNEVYGLVMEHLSGIRLDKFIRHNQNLNETIVQSFSKQLIDALAYMHLKLIMHRDIKSSNIMVVGGKIVKLIDFGMAKHFSVNDHAYSDFESLTTTIVGTLPYMAPELKNLGYYNSKIDVWSLGVIVFEMASGDVFLRTLRGDYTSDILPLTQAPDNLYAPTMSLLGNSFMQTCLIKNPDYRPFSYNLLKHPFISNSRNPATQHTAYYPYVNYKPIINYDYRMSALAQYPIQTY